MSIIIIFFAPHFLAVSQSDFDLVCKFVFPLLISPSLNFFCVSFNLPLVDLNVYLLSTIGSSLYKPGNWAPPYVLHQPNYSK